MLEAKLLTRDGLRELDDVLVLGSCSGNSRSESNCR